MRSILDKSDPMCAQVQRDEDLSLSTPDSSCQELDTNLTVSCKDVDEDRRTLVGKKHCSY